MCLGIPGQIVEIVDEDNDIATVDVSGIRRNISVALVRSDGSSDALLSDGIAPGDWVLVHVGFAMSKIDEAEAQETLRMLQELGQVYQDELEDLSQSRIE